METVRFKGGICLLPLSAPLKGNQDSEPTRRPPTERRGEGGQRREVSLGLMGDICVYLRSSTMRAGFSRYSFHRLEKRHMVAPSMMRWSADQLTFMM